MRLPKEDKEKVNRLSRERYRKLVKHMELLMQYLSEGRLKEWALNAPNLRETL